MDITIDYKLLNAILHFIILRIEFKDNDRNNTFRRNIISNKCTFRRNIITRIFNSVLISSLIYSVIMRALLKEELSKHISQSIGNADKFGSLLPKATNTIPLNISYNQLRRWNNLQILLHKSITNIVAEFMLDKDVKNVINLSDKEMNIIENCNRYERLLSKNYSIGSFRPDLVIEENTQQTKICEINARFAINGFMSSLCLSQSLSETNPSFKRYNYPKYNSLYDQHFDYTKPIFIIKGKEYGSSIYLYKSFN
eukprot:329443_1